jgi:hypothetical protein
MVDTEQLADCWQDSIGNWSHGSECKHTPVEKIEMWFNGLHPSILNDSNFIVKRFLHQKCDYYLLFFGKRLIRENHSNLYEYISSKSRNILDLIGAYFSDYEVVNFNSDSDFSKELNHVFAKGINPIWGSAQNRPYCTAIKIYSKK